MTISSTNRKAGPYTGNDSTTAFPFAFKVFSQSDVLVVRANSTGSETTLVLNTDYTVALNVDQDNSPGGMVTLSGALATGYTLVVSSSLQNLQPTDLTNQGGFYPRVISNALDRLTILVQQLAESVSRSLKTSITTPPGVNPTLPAPVPYQLIGWNGTGTGFQNTDPTYSTALATDLGNATDFLKGVSLVKGAGRVVSSIADLRALPKTGSPNVCVTGYYAPGDGGGGFYYYDAADTTSADNGGTIIVATDGGRWKLAQSHSVSVRQFGAKGSNTTDAVAAIQACILASVGMTALGQAPTGPLFEVDIPAGIYNVSSGSIYVPTLAVIKGAGSSTKLKTTGNNPVFVLGQNINETNELIHRLEGFEIYGNLTGANQIGIRIGLNGGYVYGNTLKNIYIRDMGGHGVYYASSNTSSMMLYTLWEEVHITNTNGYCVYIRQAVFNDALFKRCDFEEGLLGGFYVDYLGGGTTNFSETIRFDTCSFEGNGQLIGGGATYTVGSFGFSSMMLGGQYVFDNCYIENNAMQSGDTTGCAIKCQAPVMLSIKNSYLVGANNLVYLYRGGRAEIEGCYIDPKTNFVAMFTFDGAPTADEESYLRIGINKWYTQYVTAANLSRSINGATTKLIGYRPGRNNYLVNQPRSKNIVLRDVSDNAANTGAIGYNAVRRLTNNADGTVTIGINAVASICVQNVYTLALISDTYNSRSALFLICPTGLVLISQVGTLYTTTKDNAGTINVYYDAGTGNYVLQNKTANALSYLAVRFIGCEAMLSADNYSTYEGNYLQGN